MPETYLDSSGRLASRDIGPNVDPDSLSFRHFDFASALQAGRLPHDAEYYARKFEAEINKCKKGGE